MGPHRRSMARMRHGGARPGVGRLQTLVTAALKLASRHRDGQALAPIGGASIALLRAPGVRWLASGAPPPGIGVSANSSPPASRDVRDPERPRKPAGPFVLFGNRERRTLPKMSAAAAAKILSEKWAAMTDKEKVPYIQESNCLMHQFEAELAEYRASGKEAIWQATRGLAREAKLDDMDPERPRRPANPFALFTAESATSFSVDITKSSVQNGQMWKAMGVEERAPFVQKAAALRAAYDEQMAEYRASGREAEWKAMVRQHLPRHTAADASEHFNAELRKTVPSIGAAAAQEVWRSMSKDEQRPYRAMAARARDKKRVDPERPKRPMGAFFLFQRESSRPDTGDAIANAKVAGRTWKAMSDEEKAPYVEKAVELMRDYKERMLEYETSGKEAAWEAAQATSGELAK